MEDDGLSTIETPVYTKEMDERGELPPIGCYAIITISINNINAGDEVMIGGYANFGGEDVAVFCKSLLTATATAGCFKPIDTRTDEEKLRDDILFYIDDGGISTLEGAIEKAFGKFTITLNEA